MKDKVRNIIPAIQVYLFLFLNVDFAKSFVILKKNGIFSISVKAMKTFFNIQKITKLYANLGHSRPNVD